MADKLRTLLDVTLTKDEAEYIAAFITEEAEPGDGAVRLMVGDGHAGYGLYAADPEYPDEGAILVKSMEAPDGVSEHWSTQPRQCGICGVRDIPRGVEWHHWRAGKPVHPACADGVPDTEGRQG